MFQVSRKKRNGEVNLKKLILLLAFILFFSSNIPCFSLPKPKKNKDVGCIIGMISIEIDKDFRGYKAGTYTYEFWLQLKNKDTGKKYSVVADENGFYYLLNLPPGDYLIVKCNFENRNFETTTSEFESSRFISNIMFEDQGIEVKVSANKLKIVKKIKISAELLPDQSQQTFKKSFVLEDFDSENLEELKTYFNELDRKNFWAEFEWEYEL